VDTSSPTQTLTINGYTDGTGSITGNFASGTTTDDTTPVLYGTLSAALAANEFVRVFRGGTAIGTATVTGTSGSYEDGPLADGNLSYTFRVVDAAGNSGTLTSAFGVIIDTTAPVATASVASYDDDFGTYTGTFAITVSTDDTTPMLRGTLSAALGSGEKLELFRNGSNLGTVSVIGTAWFYSETLSTDGAYVYTVRVSDAAGNNSGMSAGVTLTLDRSAPIQFPSLWYIQDDVGLITGTINASGGYTDDTTPTLTGTLAAALVAGDIVQVLRGGTVIGTASVFGTSWTYQDSGLTNGSTYGYTTRIVDQAGNAGPQSPAFTLSVDTTPPTSTASALAYTDDFGALTGSFAITVATDDTTPIITGTLSAALGVGERVQLFRNGTNVGTALVSGTGWTYAETLSTDGSYVYTVRVSDTAGNLGTASAGVTITLDRVAPTQTIAISYITDDVAPVTGTLGSGGTTNDTSITMTGSLSGALGSGEQVYVYRDSVYLGTATVTGTSWTLAAHTVVNGSTYSYTAKVIDAAGNQGIISSAFTLSVDTTGPAQSITMWFIDDYGSSTGTRANGSTFDDITPTVAGTLSAALAAGEVVQILRGGNYIGTATVSGTGWSYTDSLTANGAYTYSVSVKDLGGNTSTAVTSSITVYGKPTQIVYFGLGVDDEGGAMSTIVSSGYLVDDVTPKMIGTLSAPLQASSEVLLVYRDGSYVGQATVTGTSWNFTDSSVPAGNHAYTAMVAGALENGAVSSPYELAVLPAGSFSFTKTSGVLDTFLFNSGSRTIDFTRIAGGMIEKWRTAYYNYANIDVIDLGLSGSTTIKLDVTDVIEFSPYKFVRVLGDSNDQVQLVSSGWANLGNGGIGDGLVTTYQRYYHAATATYFYIDIDVSVVLV